MKKKRGMRPIPYYSNAEVSNIRHFFVQGPIGSRDGFVTFYRTKDDTVWVRCGCFSGSLQEFVDKAHGGSRYEKEYKLAAELAKVCIRLEGESKSPARGRMEQCEDCR